MPKVASFKLALKECSKSLYWLELLKRVNYKIENGKTTAGELRAFYGTIDGNGHTIYNLTSTSAYSVQGLNAKGTNYLLYELQPSLLGNSCAEITNNGTVVVPTVKNLTLEDVNIMGSNAAAVVSYAYYAIDLDNVTVMGGTITSSAVSGGLIGRIEGLNIVDDGAIVSNIVSNITNCYTLVDIYGSIVGGAVGYVTNASETNESTLNVINFLNRGTIRTSGINIDAEYEDDSYQYYKATAGSVVGVTLIKNLRIINTINMGSVISYSEGPMVGGFIGSVGVGDMYKSSNINIVFDGCKQIGQVYYIFDEMLSSVGTMIGGTYSDLASIVNLTITNTNHTNMNGSVINDNQMDSLVSITSNLNTTTDVLGEGVFDIYNDDYYTNGDYFNQTYQWSSDETVRLYFIVTFRDHDGTKIQEVVIKDGEVVSAPDTNPSRESTVAYDYTFEGWSEDLTSIHRSISVYAEYSATLRNYEVKYYDLDGKLIDTLILPYDSLVNAGVDAPEKESNFFFKYKFLRWGEVNQKVTGNLEVKPVYQITLTNAGIISLFVVISFVIACAVFIATKKKI